MNQLTFQLEKSPSDTRNYKVFGLRNGMTLLMIEDPQAELSACAISVGVGSLANPDRSLGLAHFLEHMLFMGSKKYPSVNEYSQFISMNGGMNNAVTTDDKTTYFFSIDSDKILEAVDRITSFMK